MTGFVFLRVRAHRLLLAAAVLAVLLTTSVLAALTAFSGSIGDAALRHTLTHRSAASASLVISAQVEREQREAADATARKAARETFDGLAVTVRTLEASGPYALPRSLQAPAARRGDPDLTRFASLDRSRVRLTAGRMPGAGSGRNGAPVEVALPSVAADVLKLKPGARLTLTDRLADGTRLPVLITGLYEAADQADPYWQLDELGGRGIRKVVFTTYGPLLTDPAVLDSGRISSGEMSWLAVADFRTVTTDRIDALHTASTRGPKALLAAPEFKDGALAQTSLPTVLDQIDRALLVSRSTLMIVAVQLVLLAGYALLLVARLLSSERGGRDGTAAGPRRFARPDHLARRDRGAAAGAARRRRRPAAGRAADPAAGGPQRADPARAAARRGRDRHRVAGGRRRRAGLCTGRRRPRAGRKRGGAQPHPGRRAARAGARGRRHRTAADRCGGVLAARPADRELRQRCAQR